MKKILIVLIFSLSLTACADKYMAESQQAVDAIAADEVAVIFLRAGIFSSTTQTPIAEIVNDDIKSVAILSNYTKAIHKTTPGKHFYAVGGSEAARVLEADLEAGRFYYVYINPRIGASKARFTFMPVEYANDESLQKDLISCTWLTPNAQTESRFSEIYIEMKEKADKAFADTGERIYMPAGYGVTRPVR